MRILIVAPSVVPIGGDRYGGVENLVRQWSKALVRAGQDVTVAAPYGSKVPDGVRLWETVSLRVEQDRDDIAEKTIANFQAATSTDFDVIHDYTHHHVFKDSDRAIHMMHDPIRTRFDFKAKKNVLCYSEWQAKRFEAMYGQKALVMPCNFVDTDVFKPDPQAKRERFLFLGKLTPDKGALRALSYCIELHYPLDIVGGLIPSDSTAYKEVVERMAGKRTDITFHFNVTEAEKLKFLQNAKALIYPQSLDDSHWLTGIEAWACGTPTVCYDHGAMREVCPSERMVVQSEDEFKEKMRLFSKAQYDYAGGFLSEFTEAHYSVKAILPKWLALYQAVANGETWA